SNPVAPVCGTGLDRLSRPEQSASCLSRQSVIICALTHSPPGGFMDNRAEIRTAFQVARLGTESGAADVLGVHHATASRHIDAREKRRGTRLFQRHTRGYTPTEAGRDLLTVAQTTEEQFAQLSSRIKGHGETVQGEFVITA